MLRKNPITKWTRKEFEPSVDATAFVDETAVVVGDVRVGKNAMICPNAVIRADEGFPIIIGEKTNVQDSVVIHALKGTSVKIGKRCSIAHDAIVHGPCEIGDNSFIGFNSAVLKAKIRGNALFRTASLLLEV